VLAAHRARTQARLPRRRDGVASPPWRAAHVLAPAGGLRSRRGAARGEVARALQRIRAHDVGGEHLRRRPVARVEPPSPAHLPGLVGTGAVPAPLRGAGRHVRLVDPDAGVVPGRSAARRVCTGGRVLVAAALRDPCVRARRPGAARAGGDERRPRAIPVSGPRSPRAAAQAPAHRVPARHAAAGETPRPAQARTHAVAEPERRPLRRTAAVVAPRLVRPGTARRGAHRHDRAGPQVARRPRAARGRLRSLGPRADRWPVRRGPDAGGGGRTRRRQPARPPACLAAHVMGRGRARVAVCRARRGGGSRHDRGGRLAALAASRAAAGSAEARWK
jgi:hypothetical protein